jgi:hypothetical protein
MDPQSKPNAATPIDEITMMMNINKTAESLFHEAFGNIEEITGKNRRGELNEEQWMAAVEFTKRVNYKSKEVVDKLSTLKLEAVKRQSATNKLSLEVAKNLGTMDTGKVAQLQEELEGLSKERRKDLETAVKWINNKTKEIQEELAELDPILNK